MTIDIHQIAQLAHLEIKPGEIDHYQQELTQIFNLIEQMKNVDVSGIEPMTHSLDSKPITRADAVTERVTETDQLSKLQQLAPQVYKGLYIVPQVIE